MKHILLISSLFLFFSSTLSAQTLWVDDKLTITMRAGAGNEFKILRVLTSGQKLESGKSSADGNWLEVKFNDSDKTGWVLKKYTSSKPIAKIQLAKKQKQLIKTQEKLSALQSKQSQLEATFSKTKQLLKDTQEKLKKASGKNVHYEEVAAQPIRLAERNTELNKSVSLQAAEISQLKAENTRLSNDNSHNMVMAGGFVLFFGLLLGWFITKRVGRSQSVWR